jgi:hypothetical protein
VRPQALGADPEENARVNVAASYRQSLSDLDARRNAERAAAREAEDPHTITVESPEVTRADLEAAWQGLPSRSVSPRDLIAVYEYRERLGREKSLTLYPGDPGTRLLEAEDNSPEMRAAFERYQDESHQEFLAEEAEAERLREFYRDEGEHDFEAEI